MSLMYLIIMNTFTFISLPSPFSNVCFQCTENLRSQIILQKNLRNLTNTRQNTARPETYQKEMMDVHADVQIYNCHKCDDSFELSGDLATHVRLHSG